MCGRYALTRTTVELAEHFIASDENREQVLPDFNVAPTRREPIVVTWPAQQAVVHDGPAGQPLEGESGVGGASGAATRAAQRQLRLAR